MTDHRHTSTSAVALTSTIAAGGMLAHNVLEFGPVFVLSPETLIPLAIFGVLARIALARPAGMAIYVALLAWAALNLVGGGLSVLPLGLFPVEPEQSIGHYAAHALYAAMQLPLIVVATRALRAGRPGSLAADVR